ncbi:pilus assembly protein PilM [Thiorhodococcus mannitoliphagus]|uniref:Pilus assembly protein PilM n=1 Tax=Thiorhodococcus mannitoliphagus TaxID=329406 RepID=A0A6P1DPZ2_9GAMM|nr:PilN domain-containing protein [Thiorhodococcus mannitoliphagus]NEX18736.1 pilus assembly protein PilM [Thiorhodococcus mannitoliphagus]
MTLFQRLNDLLTRTSLPSPLLRQAQAAKARLLGCLPPVVRQALARRNPVLLINVDGERATLDLTTGFETEPVGEVDLRHSLSLPSEIAESDKGQNYSVELRLPQGAVLTRSVSFPIQVRANLGQVVRYELDRLTPFQPDDVVFDFAQQPAPKSANRFSLDLAVCRRDLVEQWIERMTALGAPLDRISWPDAWPGANLLPAERRPARRRFRPGLNAVLTLVAVLLGVAVLVTPLWQKEQLAGALDRELSEARRQAIAVDELRQELERARKGSTLVLEKKLEQPPILELLRELTDRLPEDTWIQNLEVDDDEVDLRGESGQATALIALLEQAPGIEGVSFKSPVTQIARTGKERFNISFRYVRQREE